MADNVNITYPFIVEVVFLNKKGKVVRHYHGFSFRSDMTEKIEATRRDFFHDGLNEGEHYNINVYERDESYDPPEE